MHGHHHNPNLVNTNSTAYPTQTTTATGIPSTTHHHHTTPTTAYQPGMKTNNVTATNHPTAPNSHPSRVHAAVENAVGSMQSSIGRMTNNPNTIIKGEEKKVAARAEADMAKLRHAKKQHASMGI
ncbi:uncharacterized protein SPPG_01754 [Spizellomyces punctatus DAOM BR117]|uniref:CsbD-like domain-containing protein n=1 Tax=Spizellomyces punctatus (strain DAOM BR117) TaxID=645134 RepID=A0A0L0HPE8_SPIPD|nr:uncharacterized protein SPPG_01754 [Spizellomyces punctatus DAOM BR117]KND02669.1 hypothetical protein SPPG_01754 [Spizellomyces punctatus DAOM BR117]|eukprot:XP_016610708.1 hypothetical protein SPPG_01754 [Spizellomyces punctatus DAOM BR117]